MPVTRLNHAVLYVSDLERAVAFYRDVLGFEQVMGFPGAAFLRGAASTNDHDLGLFEVGATPAPTRAGVGLYHLAWEVDTLDELARLGDALAGCGALVGASDHGTTKSLYARDPDGLELEVVWIVPAALLTEADIAAGRSGIRPLDLAAEQRRFGGATRGGLGISVPLGVTV